jgi:hypothetical protein
MKLAIIGDGKASAIAILTVLDLVKNKNYTDLELFILHDTIRANDQLATAANPVLNRLLKNVINFNDHADIKKIQGSMRLGISHTWHDDSLAKCWIQSPSPGLHFNGNIFFDFVVESVCDLYANVTYQTGKMRKLNQSDMYATVSLDDTELLFDYVIDTTGLDQTNYTVPDFAPVDKIITAETKNSYNESHTSITFHDNGYSLGIPLVGKKVVYYFYNSKIINVDQAVGNFNQIASLNTDPQLKDFNPRYKKYSINDRIIYAGPGLFYMEPIQALPFHFYQDTIKIILSNLMLENYNKSLDIEANQGYITNMELKQDLIALTYHNKNNYSSEFWKQARDNSKKYLSQSEHFKKFVDNYKNTGNLEYDLHDNKVAVKYITGLGIDLDKIY